MSEQGSPPESADASATTSGSAGTDGTPKQQGASSSGGGSGKKTYKPLELPTPEQIMQQDAADNCFVKSVIAGAMGGVAGVAFGLFFASMDMGGASGAGVFETGVPTEQTKPTRVVLKEMWLSMKSRSVTYAKGFAVMGLLYSGAECVIEKYRAKHDKWNATYAGCAAGAALAHSGGAKAMCLGCGTFAAFSTAIEHFMDR